MSKRTLTGHAAVLLCGLVLASTPQASVGAETFLPLHELMFSGSLTIPACTITLSPDVHFEADTRSGVQVQHQQLLLSQCDVEGVDVAFQADTLPGQASRGALTSMHGHRRSAAFHYRIGPDNSARPGAEDGTLPLQPDTGAVALEKDSAVPDINPEGRYFSLQDTVYPYRLPAAGGAGEGRMSIPFVVTLHHDAPLGRDDDDEALTGIFRLRVTYR